MKTLYVFLSVILAIALAGCVSLQGKVAVFGEKTMFVKGMEDGFRNGYGNNQKAKPIAWGTWVMKTQPDGKKKFGSWFAFYAETTPTIGDHVLMIVNENEIKIDDENLKKIPDFNLFIKPFLEMENLENYIRWDYPLNWKKWYADSINMIYIEAESITKESIKVVTMKEAPNKILEAIHMLENLGSVEKVKIHFYN